MAVLLSAMWGLNIVGIKIALAVLPPAWNAFWRGLIGLPVLGIWARTGRVSLSLLPGELGPLLLLAAFFASQIILLNTSIGLTSAGYAAVLVNFAPVLINVISHFFAADGDRLSQRRVIGLALGLGGVSVTMLGRPDTSMAPDPLVGNALAALTTLILSIRTVYIQRLVQRMDATKAMFWQVAISIPVFLVLGALTEPMLVGPLTVGPVLACLYCSVGVVGVAFIVWARLLKANPAGLISVFLFPTPVFGVLFSALILGERLATDLVFGVIGVAGGILLVTLEQRRGRTARAHRDPARVPAA